MGWGRVDEGIDPYRQEIGILPLTGQQENCNKTPPGRGDLSDGVSFSKGKQALFPNSAGFFR